MVLDPEFKPWITLRHVAENGPVTQMIPHSFTPLRYLDVIQQGSKHHIEYEGELADSKNGGRSGKSVAASMNIEFRRRTSIYALVEGGWLPVPFVPPGIFIIDQNVLIILAKIADGRIRPDYHDIWHSFLNNPRLVINPVFCAWEGNLRRVPTYSEFCDYFDEASARISAALPKASVIKFEEMHYQAAYTSITDFTERQKKETEFLLYAVPLITVRASTSRLKEYQKKLVNKAKELGLNDRSLVVLATFSCLFDRRDGSGYQVGRRILKPHRNYTDEDAYNALSDLRSVELTICSRAVMRESLTLCTRDRALAAFWCLINPQAVTVENGKFTYSLSFAEDLFPRLSHEELGNFVRELGGRGN